MKLSARARVANAVAALRRVQIQVRPKAWHLAIAALLVVAFYVVVDRRVADDRRELTYSAADAAVELLRQKLLAKGDLAMVKGELFAGSSRVASDDKIAPSVKSESHFDCAVFQGRTPVATTLRATTNGRTDVLGEASEDVIQTVLIKGSDVRASSIVLGKPYVTLMRPLRDKNGSILGIVAVYKDESEIDEGLALVRVVLALCLAILFVAIALLHMTSVQTIREVERQAREIVRHRERENRFFANMSHELRTPLAAIRGFAAMLDTDTGASPADSGAPMTPKMIGARIDREAADLLGLVNNLLDYAKLASSSVELLLEDVPVEKLVKRATVRCGALIGEKPIQLTTDVSPGLVARCDFVKTTQVLTNLVANAIKFTEKGTVTVRVRDGLTAPVDDRAQASIAAGFGAPVADGAVRAIEFHVIDTGCGIPLEAIDKIWEAFQQADAGIALKHGGTGLGLSIVRGLVEQMGGTVGVRSRVGVGSVFRFSLPMAGAAQVQAGHGKV